MSLYALMKDFCVDAYRELSQMKELPRPPYSSPSLARNPQFTHWGSTLYKLKSHETLQNYMQTSGLQKRLHDVGHTWVWHEEVFEWLFLERLIAESSGGDEVDRKAFDNVFRRAQAELNRPSFRLRRITALVGIPELKRPIELSKGVILAPITFETHHYQLADMLGWRYQDKHRAPAFWLDPDSRLLVQTRLVKKGEDGKDLSYAREQMRYEAKQIVKAIKMSLDTAVLEKYVFAAYLSSFPLLPIAYEEIEETKGMSISNTHLIRRKEINNIRSCYGLIGSRAPVEVKESQFFLSAVDRFAGSFRSSQLEQSVVDLIVALEALFPTGGEQLKYRLAIYVASLLGTSADNRKRLYEQVSAGYDLRNSIVHGRENQAKSMADALRAFPPELKGKPANEVNKQIGKAVWQLQQIVRNALKAYVHMKTNDQEAKWLTSGELECLLFDPIKCTEAQKRLGLNRKNR